MFELLSTLLRGTNSKPVGATAGHVATTPLTHEIRAAEAAVNSAKRDLASLVRQQRVEQTGLNLLRSRQAALEDRVRQAMANGSDDLATNGARAIADLENQAAMRMQTLARLDEKVSRLRHALAQAQRRVTDLRQATTGNASIGSADGPERFSDPQPHDRGVAEEPATRVRAEDILVRLRTTPAPTTQYLNP